ncbi:MAG: LlaJI family restriction endonuclease [Roseburia sp.]|nr:LlaJI family restriction endonuclease [Roseburia sp.]
MKCENGDFSVNFPLGFDVSEDDKELRRDILLLLETIRLTTSKKESTLLKNRKQYEDTCFPFQAYMFILYDFYARGYYKEREVRYSVSKRGKTDWNRTIKTQKAYIQGTDVFYLDYVTKKNSIKNDEMITRVHAYCVYESFSKLGWLFSGRIPERPGTEYNEKRFTSVIVEKLSQTFNDKNRKLFQSMLAVVKYQGDNGADKNYQYGTYSFEYVWEAMIDRVYGISAKGAYFPKTEWSTGDGVYGNSTLRPDTIMLYQGNVYVLDAKYYKYGVTHNMDDLPGSTSVHKQITYGEYIAEQEKFREIHGENYRVYNAFLMPYNVKDHDWNTDHHPLWIGEATSDWKHNEKSYEKIHGILIDVKYLMQIHVRRDGNAIMQLAEEISRHTESVPSAFMGERDGRTDERTA